MPYLRSSFATQCTTATLSWCRTPTGVWSSGATAGPFCCFTRWEGGPRTTTCPSPGEWSSTPPCWKRASLIRRPPSYPSSLHPWCMRGQPRWSWWGMSYLWLNAWGYFINNTPPTPKKKEGSSFLLYWQCRGLQARRCLQIPEGKKWQERRFIMSWTAWFCVSCHM